VRTITAIENATLDGVVQAPGRPDEDRRDGFTRGGRTAPSADAGPPATLALKAATPTGAGVLTARFVLDGAR